MTIESPTPSTADGAAEPPFWVTRTGAHVALIALHAAAALSVLVEILRPFPDGAHVVERVHALDFPASYAIYGFVACVGLVAIGRLLRRLVMRAEDYYREGN